MLKYAIDHGLAVLTLNRRHFVKLHREQPGHQGIIVCSFDPDFETLAARIHGAVETNMPLAGKLLRVNRP